MNEFKTFIASSLKPEFLDHRRKLVEALQSLNNDPDLQPLNFSTYRFESEGSNASHIGGIQNHINLAIEKCMGFVLICDSNIGKKTVAEFKKALDRFNKNLNPAFIIILKSNNTCECGPNQITYEKFKSDYLTLFDYNHDGKINDDVIGYEFDFDDIESACDKLKKDLKEWIINENNRPLFITEQGRDVTPEFLYKDENRIDCCKDPMYYRRHFDDMLDKAIQEKERTILIKGASLSGKTRALYQAIKNAQDTWFYKFKERHDEEKIAAEIKQIAEYLEFAHPSIPICLIFDDIHQMPSSSNIAKAVDRLMDSINGKSISILMTSTLSDDPLIPATKTLTIKPLTRKECYEAAIFFNRFGRTVESEYREIGAMMIDLKGMRRTYNTFETEGENPQVQIARTCALNAIKASSIWHSSNIGNVKSLSHFTRYLLSRESSIDERKIPSLVADSINGLTTLPGINKEDNPQDSKRSVSTKLSGFIQIEEYVYRYILSHLSFEDEWEWVNQILLFLNENRTDKDAEPLIVCLSKVARRAENQEKMARLLYELIMSIYLGDADRCPEIDGDSLSNAPWYEQLEEEIADIKYEVGMNPTLANEDCSKNCIYMAKIIWTQMLFEGTYEDAEKIFNSVPFPLQNMPMLGVLIFKSAGNQEKLKALIESRKLETSFYIINKMIPHATDFEEALSYFMKGEFPYKDVEDYIYSATELRQMLERREMQGDTWEELKLRDINRQQFIMALNSLATKVGRISDLDKLLKIIKDNYVYLLDNLEYANSFNTASNVYSKDNLTMIDLLSCLNFHCLRTAFVDIMAWGKQIPLELDGFIDRIIQEFVLTSELTTTSYKAKHSVSTIFNVFIEKCAECKFEDVLENIFKKMYVQKGNKIVNLCDSYTYSTLMRNKNCKYIDALDLYNNFIEPHSKDPEGHFLITHFILNEILNKVRSVSEYNKVNKIFTENNVTKDNYTYNVVLRNLTYTIGVEQILPNMLDDKIEIDSFTLGNLISKAPHVGIATSFFYPLRRLGIKSEHNMITRPDLRKEMEDKIKKYTKDSPLESQHFLWASLVESHCRNEEDREVIFKVLEYLEKPGNKESIFGAIDHGIIYNNCLKNRSLIRNYEEAEEFISSKKIKIDRYTLSHLIKIIIHDYKNSANYEEDIPLYLNDVFKRNKDLIMRELQDGNTFIYNERLKAYKSHEDEISFVFIRPDGEVFEKPLTPFGYLKTLIGNGLPVDQYTLSCFAEIAQGQTYNLLKDFLKFTKDNKLYVNHYTIDSLVKHFKRVIPDDERIKILGEIFELPLKDNIISPSKATIDMFSHGLCSLREAFERVDGNDTEKLYRYTQLLSLFRKRQIEKNKVTGSEDFRNCMNLYSEFVKNANIKPNSDLYSNLANFATTREELEEVFKEMELEKVDAIPYMLTPILCISMTANDIKELIEKYLRLNGAELGRKGSEIEVDAILRGLGILLRRYKNSDIHEIVTELTNYILSDAPSSIVLNDFPAFQIYKKDNGLLTQNALCELICFGPKQEDESKVREEYLKNASELLKRYYRADNDGIRPKLVRSITYAASELQISCVEILQILKPYPKLAFLFAAQTNVDGYEAYRLLLESWNEGFEKISQDHAIDVLLTQLDSSKTLSEFKSIPDSNYRSSISSSILKGIYQKWGARITVADFLKPEDNALKTEAIEVTEYKENDRLRRKYLNSKFNRTIKKGNFNIPEKVRLYKSLFWEELSDVSFVKSELGAVVKGHYLKFNDTKPLLETVSGNKECVDAVLCCMADLISSYSDLRYIIETICAESVDVSEELAQKLTFVVLRKRYDDIKFGHIADQVLRAVSEDSLVLNDLLYVPTVLPQEDLLRRLRLPHDIQKLYKLVNRLSTEMSGLSSREMIEHAEGLICKHYRQPKDGKPKDSKSLIDSLTVQEFIRLHVIAYNGHNDTTYESDLLKKIETVMSIPTSDRINSSILFSEKSQHELDRNRKWYNVNSHYVSRMVISHLNCNDEKKMDMIISSQSQKFWWSNAFKGNFDKLMSFTDIVESRGDESRPYYFTDNLFNEAKNAEDFIKALKLILSGRIKDCNVSTIVDTLLRIVGNDEEYAYRIVNYNSKLFKIHGREATITHDGSTWIPDSGFFNFIFGDETLDGSADLALKDMFNNKNHIGRISRFVSEMMVMRDLRKAIWDRKDTQTLTRYITFNSEYFDKGGKICNDLLTAAYIRYTKSESGIVKKILDKSAYDTSMLPACGEQKVIFDDNIGYHVFRGLSEIIEINYKKGYSRITTQKLFHKLLYCCGNDFVLNNPKIPVYIAGTIRSVEEYRKFTEDLMKFYIPVNQKLTATLIEKLNTLICNDSWKWILGVARNRTKALAEYDHYHQGTDCHAFKAGFLLLLPEKKIDFGNFWAGQNLHLKDTETEGTVEMILSQKFIDRINAVMAIESISLRCEMMLKMYVKNLEKLNIKEKHAIWKKMDIIFEELSNTLNGPDAFNININSIIKIFTTLAKQNILVKTELNQKILTGLINYYKLQRNNDALGYYYKSNTAYVLKRISEICDMVQDGEHIKIYYSLFTNNKVKHSKAFFKCDINVAKSALSE